MPKRSLRSPPIPHGGGSHWSQAWFLLLLVARWLGRCFLLPGVLLVPLSLQPALRSNHLLGPVGRGPDQRLDVVVVDHLLLQEGVGQLQRGGRQNEGWSSQREQRSASLSWPELSAQLRPQHLQPPRSRAGCATTDGVTPGCSTVPKRMFGQEYTMGLQATKQTLGNDLQ